MCCASPCRVAGGATLGTNFLADDAGLDLVVQRTMAMIVLVTCGIYILALLCRPFNAVKALIVAAMAVGFLAMMAVPWLREFFAIHLPPETEFAEMALITGLAILALEAIYRKLRVRTGLAKDVLGMQT